MVVLCKGTGSVDEVFKLAGFNVVSVDWVHAFTTGKVEKDPADILLDRPQKERPRTAQLASLCMTASSNPLIQSSNTTFVDDASNLNKYP